MKKALIICAAGMSSSMMAKKVTTFLQGQGHDIALDATVASMGDEAIEKGEFDLYLISPQTKMYFDQFSETAKKHDRKIAPIPFEAYVPIPTGVEKLAKIVLENI